MPTESLPWEDQARELLGLLAQDEAYLQDLQRARDARPRRRGLLQGSVSTSSLGRAPASPTGELSPPKGRTRSSIFFRTRTSKPWVDYVPPPVPVASKDIRPPTIDQMERDLREWAEKRDIITHAMHEGQKQEHSRAAATIEQLAKQEAEQRDRCKRALGELKGLQMDLDDANRKVEILEVALHEMRKRATDAESARDQLQATARKHGKGVALANKEVAMKAEELEKQLAAERASRVEHIQNQIIRRIINRDISACFTAWVDVWEETVRATRDAERAVSHQTATSDLTRRAESREKELKQLQESHAKEIAELKEELEAYRLQAEVKVEKLLATREKEVADFHMQQENERREMFMRQAVRRLSNRDLSSGFNAWMEFAEARAYATKTIRQVANRLHPKNSEIAGAFYFWYEDVSAMNQKAQIEMYERRTSKLLMTIDIRDKEIRRLKTVVNVLQPETKEQIAARAKRESQIKTMQRRQAANEKKK
jgi:hypothetical protein